MCAARSLRDGDRLRLGAYEIEVRLIDQPAQGQGQGQGLGGYAGGVGHGNPFDDRFGDDPMAPPPAPRQPFGETAYPELGMGPASAQLPHDFDPLAPDRDDAAFGGYHGPVQPDHSSSMQDAMIAPPIAGYVSPQAGGVIPGDDLLPDDWDKDLLEGIGALLSSLGDARRAGPGRLSPMWLPRSGSSPCPPRFPN